MEKRLYKVLLIRILANVEILKKVILPLQHSNFNFQQRIRAM